jgi:hypothetical protein
MTNITEIDLHNHRIKIIEDVKSLIEKYHDIFDKSTFDIDDNLADAIILREMRSALKNVQDEKLNKIVN